MAEQESADLFLPVFWSLGSGSESDYHDFNRDDDDDDDFFIGSHRSISVFESASNAEFSRDSPLNTNCPRTLDLESESDSDEQIIAVGDDPIPNIQIQIQDSTDLNLPLCWDCLRIDEDRIEEFEWEEVDSGLNQEQEIYHNVEWEVLLTNQLENHDDAESFVDEGFVYANSEYDEIIFSQFEIHHHSLLKGSSPASKIVVENLPSIDFTKNDHISITCAICKDEIFIEEKGKKLPCSHCYHLGCMLPWFEMRNTCPLCRFELPTDDQENENESVRYDFEILHEI